MKRPFIFTVLIASVISIVSCQKDASSNGKPEMVDLGLSVKWATCNLGASKPEAYGQYYQWGDPKGYGSDLSDGKYFGWSDKNGNIAYKWCSGSNTTLTKYNTDSNNGVVDNKTVLDREDDAVSVAYGGKWRTPTDFEWEELLNKDNCSWTWITTLDGVTGYKVQSKIAGYTDNWIFLPTAGFRYNDSMGRVGSIGYYWSSSIIADSTFDAYFVGLDANSFGRAYSYRYRGLSVRPVSD